MDDGPPLNYTFAAVVLKCACKPPWREVFLNCNFSNFLANYFLQGAAQSRSEPLLCQTPARGRMLAARPSAGCCRRGRFLVSNQSLNVFLPMACALVKTGLLPQTTQVVATLEARIHHCSGLIWCSGSSARAKWVQLQKTLCWTHRSASPSSQHC